MSYGGASGGAGKISTASDVSLNTPADQDVLSYNSSIQKWINSQPQTVVAATTSTSGTIVLAGDLTGTSSLPSVAKIKGVAISGTPTNGQVLTATGATAANWATPSSSGMLGNSGVTAGTYGSSTMIPVITVNTQGIVTAATSTAATGGGSGSAGADDTLVYNAAAHGITTSMSDIGPTLNGLITTVSSAGGGVIAFPAGNYNVGTTINLKGGVYLISFAPNHGYIAASPSSQSVKFSQNSGMTGWMIDTPNGGWSMGIQGIDLSGNGNSNSGGIRFQGVYWGAIKQSMANGFGMSGFRQEQGSQGNAGFACVYEDLMTTNCVNTSVSNFTGAFDIDGTDHYVSRCEFAARSLNSGIANTNRYVVACVIRGSNHFLDTIVGETSDKGFYITATKSRFVNLRADTNNGDGFHITGGTNRFTNCDSIGNGQAQTNTYDGFIVDNGAWGITFTSCSVFLAGSITCRYGFNDTMTVNAPEYAAGYVNCKVESAGTAHWNISGSSSAVLFPPYPISPTMGSTLDVRDTSGVIDLVNFTSPTTVTSFINGLSGQQIKVLGNSNVTIANNSVLKTNTGSSAILANGRMYGFTCYKGTWYME